MGAIKGLFGGGWGSNNNNNNNPPPRPPSSGGGGALASVGGSTGKSNVKTAEFGKGASPARTMRKG
jgi:hypothetical protein